MTNKEFKLQLVHQLREKLIEVAREISELDCTGLPCEECPLNRDIPQADARQFPEPNNTFCHAMDMMAYEQDEGSFCPRDPSWGGE